MKTNKEIIDELFPYYEDMSDIEVAQTASRRVGADLMADYKDEQHAKEKQRWIEKVADFINEHFYLNINNKAVSKNEYYTFTELIRDFNKYIEQ